MKGQNGKNSSGTTRWATVAVAATIAVCIIVSSGWGANMALADSPSPSNPDATCPAGGQCFADVTAGNAFYSFINRIYQQDLVTGYPCGGTGEPCDGQSRPYYRPNNNVTRQQMAKFIDNARRLAQIHIDVISGTIPIYANNTAGTAIGAYSTSGQALVAQSSSGNGIYAQTGEAAAIVGYSTSGYNGVGVYGDGYTGVKGNGDTGVRGDGSNVGVYGEGGAIGVRGDSDTGKGVSGISTSSDGVYGQSDTGVAVYGWSNSTPVGWAGWFLGNVRITHNCCGMGAGYTEIDDPLDPANKVLNQSLVQSPDMIDIYRGHVTLDSNGSATVQLPPYFEALNRDFDYQLTPVGAPMPDLYVAQEVQGNTFKIAGGKPGNKVSWQVTGTRRDPYAVAHPIQPEQDKPANEQGKYLHPTEYGQPVSLGIGYDEHQAQQAAQPKP